MYRGDEIDIIRSNERLPVREDTSILPDIYGATQPSQEHRGLQFEDSKEVEGGSNQSKDERSRGVDGGRVAEQ